MREITDEDGDGVEDNVKMSSQELDKFYKPAVFKHAEEMHNTRNGELPGHHLKEDHKEPEGPHASDLINNDTGVPIVQEHVQLSMDDLSGNFYDNEYNSVPTDLQEPVNEERATLAEKFASDPVPIPVVQAQALAQQKVEAEHKEIDQSEQAGIVEAALNERSQNEYEDEPTFIQIDQDKFSEYVNAIQGPEDLEFLSVEQEPTVGYDLGNNDITDADGDGVEDNIYWVSSEYDKFYRPAVYGVSEDIYNTHHGNLPGHRQLEHDLIEAEPLINPTTLIKSDYWNKLGTTPGGI